jgi:hypothetical protein
VNSDAVTEITIESTTINGKFISNANLMFNGTNYMIDDIPCIREGTLIETPFGKKKVECLRKNDLVYTTGKNVSNLFHSYDSRMAVPIRFVGRKTSVVNNEAAPVRIPKDLFKKGIPCEHLYVSRNHGVLVHGELIPAVVANGVSCESYLECGNRKSLQEVGRPLKICSL